MIEVKIKHVSETKIGFRSRALEIKIENSKPIQTPTRSLTNYEINKKRKLPTQIYLDNPIVFYAEPVKSPNFTQNRRAIREKINRFEAVYGDLVGLHTLVIPCLWPKKELLRNRNFNHEFVDIITTAFIESDADFRYTAVGIPPLYGLNFREYCDILNGLNRKFEKYNTSLVPIFPLDYNHFEKLVDYAIKNLQLKLIGFKYGQIKSYIPQYLFMRKHCAEKDVAFISVNTKRRENLGVKNFAVMHLLPFVGADIFASSIGPFGGRKEGNLPKFSLFKRTKLQLLPLQEMPDLERKQLFDEFLNQINVRDSELEKIVNILTSSEKMEIVLHKIYRLLESNDRGAQKKGNEMLERISSLPRVQEVVASESEFRYLQKYIIEDDTKTYLESRRNLTVAGSSLKISSL